MKNYTHIIFAIFCAILTLSVATPTYAVATEEIHHTIQTPEAISAATVNLYCRITAGKTIMTMSGSGVFIDTRGVILTNAHVAQFFLLPEDSGRATADCAVRTGTPAVTTYKAAVLYISPQWLFDNVEKMSEDVQRGTGENDFALLYITEAKTGAATEPFPAVSFTTTDALSVHDEVTVAGYPSENVPLSDVRKGLAQVAATSTITNIRDFMWNAQDVLTIAASALGAQGVSGGPVVDTDSTLIGIATAKSDRVLRAISLPYIDRSIYRDTGISLRTLLSGNFQLRNAVTQIRIGSNTIETLAQNLRKRK